MILATIAATVTLATTATTAILPDKPSKNAQRQADGLVSAVVDRLWAEGDRFYHEGDYNRVISLGRICVEADPSFDDAYSSIGYLLWSMQEMASAEGTLLYGVKHSPQHATLNYELGYQYFRTKKFTEALPYLKKAVEYPDAQPPYFATLGHCQTRLGLHADSVVTWKKCVQKFPNFISGPKNLKDAEARVAKGGSK